MDSRLFHIFQQVNRYMEFDTDADLFCTGLRILH